MEPPPRGGTTGGRCGYNGCGTAYKLSPKGSGWIFAPLHEFQGGNDGAYPLARVVFGPDGKLYGTTNGGAATRCGMVYSLMPPPTICKSVLCPWTENEVFAFSQTACLPGSGDVVFDGAGNIYGTTAGGGGARNDCQAGCGAVYKLYRSDGFWYETTIYEFSNGSDGVPVGGVIFDRSGNLYGTSTEGTGSELYGTIYELMPGSPYWSQTPLYDFSEQNCGVWGNLIMDSSGNLYGATLHQQGEAFELSPAGGNWAFTVLYSYGGNGGTAGSLTMDVAGNLYGAQTGGGLYESGNVFKFTPSNGGWTYTSLYDFTGGSDGAEPYGTLALDAAGNIYGTAALGGRSSCGGGGGCGVVFEITP